MSLPAFNSSRLTAAVSGPVPAVGPSAAADSGIPLRGRAGGFTLLELTVALTLIAILVGLGAPLWRNAVDRWAVRAVRDHAAVALHRTRLEARRWGGARLEFDTGEGLLRLRRGATDSIVWEDAALADHRVELVLPRNASGTTLTFDALGLGVVASRTLLFQRGGAEARLVISSRGRGSRR